MFVCRISFAVALLVGTTVRADLRGDAAAGLKSAVAFYHTAVAVEGGYVYRYSADLTLREGEGKAGARAIWVQPPGTPAVGAAMLEAYQRTGERAYLDAAIGAGRALVRGQLHSGGWTNRIEFDPALRKAFAYRVDGPPARKARNTSSLDDDQTQSALRLLMRLDQAIGQKETTIHDAAAYCLDAILRNQHRNGGWSQVFDGTHVRSDAPKRAEYPSEWSREYPGGEYWWHYTFNDGAMSALIETLLVAATLYGEPKYKEAAIRGGQFILAAQMPEPQPGWAQQYDANLHPAWARKFEPPAVSSSESVRVIHTLLALHRATGDEEFRKPIPRALAWLKRSTLPDGRHARFYELKTNRPLFLTKKYQLTYEANNLPTHYSFISRGLDVAGLERRFRQSAAGDEPPRREKSVSQEEVRRILAALDERGAWVEEGTLRHHDTRGPIIDSGTFIRNVERLSRYLAETPK